MNADQIGSRVYTVLRKLALARGHLASPTCNDQVRAALCGASEVEVGSEFFLLEVHLADLHNVAASSPLDPVGLLTLSSHTVRTTHRTYNTPTSTAQHSTAQHGQDGQGRMQLQVLHTLPPLSMQ